MQKSNKILLLLFLISLAVFTAGVLKLFELRFEAGDLYPAYSSLRADPLGAKALFESLENLKPLTVSRNYLPLPRLRSGRDTTLLYLGARAYELESVHTDSVKAFSRLVAAGGRLVISLFPVREKRVSGRGGRPSEPCLEKQEEKAGKVETDTGPKGSTENKQAESSSKDLCNKPATEKESSTSKKSKRLVSLADHWGVRLWHDEKVEDSKFAERAISSQLEALPDSISWHTSLYFDKLRGPWRVIYARNGHPVIIERRFGTGAVVLSADSYFFSNEALLRERHPELLAWIIGENADVVFDESHFGIQKSSGIVGLARKYRLHWLLPGIILLVGLFVWKNSIDFVPPPMDDAFTAGNDFTSDRDYTEGLVSLLRRNISSRDILSVCLKEWEKSLPSDKAVLSEKQKRLRAVIDAESPRASKQVDPVSGYQAIYQILSERKRP